jgi:hypothetical protein
MPNVKKYLAGRPINDKIILALGVAGYLILAFRYKDYMGDFGDFVKAGALIWEHQNPYPELAYVNSPVSAVIAYGLSKMFPFLFFANLWQLLNLAGMAYFFKTFIAKEFSHLLPMAFAVFAFLNVTRALFGNGQVTGLVLGLFATGITLANKSKSIFLATLPIWLALELKPQLAIGFATFFAFQNKIHKGRIILLALYAAISHAIVDIFLVRDINYYWIQKLLKYSSASMNEGYEISIWKALSIYSGQGGLLRVIAMVCVFATLCLILLLAKKGQTHKAIFIALLLPLQNTYLHLYDLAPLGLLAVLGFYVYQGNTMILLLCVLLQFFPIDIATQSAITSIFLFLYFSQAKKVLVFRKSVKEISLSLGTLWAFSFFVQNQSEELQIIILLVVPLIALVSAGNKKILRLFQLSPINR